MNEIDSMMLRVARAEAKEEMRRTVQLFINYMLATRAFSALYLEGVYEDALAVGFDKLAELKQRRKECAAVLPLIGANVATALKPYETDAPVFFKQVTETVSSFAALVGRLQNPRTKMSERRKYLAALQTDTDRLLEAYGAKLRQMENVVTV